MYMREMGTVELLTREGEIVIAKRIEEGIRELMAALAHYPGAVQAVLAEYDQVTRDERRLGDVMVGYLDPAEDVPSALEIAEAAPEVPEDEEEAESGPDPVEAKKRFTALKRQFNKTEKVISDKGRGSAAAVKEMEKLGELFKFFKLTPRVFDPLTENPRKLLAALRDHEREIMRIAVKVCNMPRKDFIATFPGSEADLKWVTRHVRKRDYGSRLAAASFLPADSSALTRSLWLIEPPAFLIAS
jgi:RNA polymerase primary sigma factor